MRTETPEGAGAGTVTLAFLAGALVGAVGALLLAPRSGVETRQRLGEAAGAAGERARRTRDAAGAAAAAAVKAFGDAMRDAPAP
jgi:gas vesicle protein